MLKKFNELSKVVRVILLIIPFVNWLVEIIVRWSLYLEKKDNGSLLMAIIVTIFFGNIVGIIDAIFTILQDTLVLTDLHI